MSCYLRISGKSFDVDGFIEESEWTNLDDFEVHKIGQYVNRLKKRKFVDSGIGICVSSASFADFDQQQKDAVLFLEKYRNTLLLLSKYSIDSWRGLDFGLDTFPQNGFCKTYLIETRLMSLCSEYGLEVYMSNYFVANERRRKGRRTRLFTKK